MSKLRIAHLRLLIPFVVIAWRAGLPVGDNSFLWHVRAGTEQLELGRVLTVDPFSFTAGGSTWRTQSWLVELGYGWLERVTGGIEWVLVMKLVLIAATVALLGIAIYRVVGGHLWFTFLGLLVTVWQAAPFAVARPALVGYVLLALVVVFVFMDRRPLWVLPPLFWLWASIHGTFPVGLGLILLDAIRRRSRPQAKAAVIAGLATALTAHGIGVWGIVLQFFRSRGALALISEWQPPDLANPFLIPFALLIVAIMGAAAAGRLRTADMWVIAPFAFFGLAAERNVWPAFIVLAPFAVAVLPRREAAKPRVGESAVANWVIAALLIGAGLLGVAHPLELREDRFPSEEAMATLEPGPLFHGSAVGGFLIYSDWPSHSVFIDDRAELYGVDGFQRYHDIMSGVGVEEAFAQHGIHQVIADTEWPLVGYLELMGWQYRYQGEDFVVMSDAAVG